MPDFTLRVDLWKMAKKYKHKHEFDIIAKYFSAHFAFLASFIYKSFWWNFKADFVVKLISSMCLNEKQRIMRGFIKRWNLWDLHVAKGNVCVFSANCVVICSIYVAICVLRCIYFMWYFRKLFYNPSGVIKVTITGYLYLEPLKWTWSVIA